MSPSTIVMAIAIAINQSPQNAILFTNKEERRRKEADGLVQNQLNNFAVGLLKGIYFLGFRLMSHDETT
jgi:hypothetical protein